ncbi:hypothetical protein [Maribacter litoralis]|uniref:hypothetical protein n=1 Tax=Maribacter litoralis TaxID=2059726 RepID=UPI003F5CDAE3
MSSNNRENFKAAIVRKIAERAGYICSNPSCNRITIGPTTNDNNKSTKTGIASHICAASIGGPRYDMSQSQNERISITNAIWLCGTCSILIDKNGGVDYPTPDLNKWKKDHEKLIKECLEGSKRLMFQFLSQQPNDLKIARKIIKFLEQRGALFMNIDYEVPRYVFESVKEIRTFLTSIQSEVETNTSLEIIIDSMNHSLRHFMNTTNSSMTNKEISYSLLASRKIIGINLKDIENIFGLQINKPLADLLPI